MPNSYYNRNQSFVPYTTARGPEVSAEYDLVESGFDAVELALNTLQADVGNLVSGAPPGWGNPLDTRWYVIDTSASTTAYTGNTTPTPGGGSITAGYRIYFAANNANTDAATLNIGSSEGAIPIYKKVGNARVPVVAGDINPLLPVELMYTGSVWLILGPKVLYAGPGSEGAVPDPVTTMNRVLHDSGAWRQVGIQGGQSWTTAGSYTWIKPQYCHHVLAFVTGGGASGISTAGANGGAGAGTAIGLLDVSAVSSVDFNVGAGGVGGNINNFDPGGDSDFMTLIGEGGGTVAPGNGVGGLINITGTYGPECATSNVEVPAGGSFWGMGGISDRGGSANRQGLAPGSGGGGVAGTEVSGSGADGCVLLLEIH